MNVSMVPMTVVMGPTSMCARSTAWLMMSEDTPYPAWSIR